MSQDIRDFVTPSCDLLGLGEPTHQEPAFGWVRNELFEQLAGHGFRSIALETDRVSAMIVDDFARDGVGTLDEAMRDGFTHTFGELETNRALVAWMREYNEHRPPEERLSFHGFDAPMEMMSAPSPRRFLEHARDYLGLDLDIAGIAGDDERWSRTEAVMDPAQSPGDTAEADRLRVHADDMLIMLYARAPELIAATSRAEWFRAETQLTAGIGMLRYHKQSSRPFELNHRVFLMSGARDALMAQNLLAIRTVEGLRGATLVFASNRHLQRNMSNWRAGDMDLNWWSAGSTVASLVGERYVFVAGSLGSSDAIALGEPESGTYESLLQSRFSTWGLMPAGEVPPADTRTDTTPPQGYFPLDKEFLDGADAILHIPSAPRRESGT